MNPIAVTANEKPLRGFSRLALFFGASITILFSYLFSATSVLFLLGLIALEFLLAVALARFGLAVFMGRVLGEHIALLRIFLRSFWLKKGVEYYVHLLPAEAPGLFGMLQGLCERAGVKVPAKVSLEMTVNAWVQLKGYRRGAGRTFLGIGYDLMAGMSQSEVEAVLAHEMMHAKLVQRGLKRILNTGLWRMGQLIRALSERVDAYRRVGKAAELPQFFLRLGELVARRKREFEVNTQNLGKRQGFVETCILFRQIHPAEGDRVGNPGGLIEKLPDGDLATIIEIVRQIRIERASCPLMATRRANPKFHSVSTETPGAAPHHLPRRGKQK